MRFFCGRAEWLQCFFSQNRCGNMLQQNRRPYNKEKKCKKEQDMGAGNYMSEQFDALVFLYIQNDYHLHRNLCLSQSLKQSYHLTVNFSLAILISSLKLQLHSSGSNCGNSLCDRNLIYSSFSTLSVYVGMESF